MTRPTRTPRRPGRRPDDPRTRIALAAITGVLTGATRAVADWLLTHLT
ncbi:hypothetical protein [Actinoplanes regularis]|nr:hypothetical protein [Actinoplanes regularis]GLW28524.1 hypothetical protein Areg01_14640 [Actinoplanes regularis]